MKLIYTLMELLFTITGEINGRLLEENQDNMELEIPHVNGKDFPVQQNSIQNHPR